MENKKIAFMVERKTLSVKERAPLPVSKETYEDFKRFHKMHGPGQVWFTAESVVKAGLAALREQLSEAA